VQTHATDASIALATDAASASDALAVRHVYGPFERDGFTPQAIDAYFVKFSVFVATDRLITESTSR
jgi:hypothetical protein